MPHRYIVIFGLELLAREYVALLPLLIRFTQGEAEPARYALLGNLRLDPPRPAHLHKTTTTKGRLFARDVPPDNQRMSLSCWLPI